MKLSRSTLALAFSIGLVPMAASAAQVIVAPVGHSAPTMSLPLLVALALALALAGVNVLRRSSPASIALFVITLASTALIGRSFGGIGSTLFIDGDSCNRQTTITYKTDGPESLLQNKCPNAMRIVSIDECADNENTTAPVVVGTCEAGLILQPEDTCELLSCE